MGASRESVAEYVGMGDDGLWPAHAWPGGYVIAYITDDGVSLCADCLDDPLNPIHFKGDADGWRIDGAVAFGATVDYPTDDETCAHCNAIICPRGHGNQAPLDG
jgi:hypothetical protein